MPLATAGKSLGRLNRKRAPDVVRIDEGELHELSEKSSRRGKGLSEKSSRGGRQDVSVVGVSVVASSPNL